MIKRKSSATKIKLRELHVLKQKNKCYWCGCRMTPTLQVESSRNTPTMATLDHLIGNEDTEDNTVAACAECNNKHTVEILLKAKELVENYKEERKDNVVSLQLITGGKTPSDNWLVSMEDGEMFLIQNIKNSTDFNLGMFMKAGNTDRAVFLIQSGSNERKPVDPQRFISEWRLYEKLGQVVEEKFEPGIPNEVPEEDKVH